MGTPGPLDATPSIRACPETTGPGAPETHHIRGSAAACTCAAQPRIPPTQRRICRTSLLVAPGDTPSAARRTRLRPSRAPRHLHFERRRPRLDFLSVLGHLLGLPAGAGSAVVQIAERDVYAPLGELDRDGPPDPAGSTADDGRPTLQFAPTPIRLRLRHRVQHERRRPRLDFLSVGELEWVVGGPGEGPNEFASLNFIRAVKDSLFVYDQWNRRVAVWTRSGTVGRHIAMEGLADALGVFSDGSILLGEPDLPVPEPGQRALSQEYRVTDQSGVETQLGRFFLMDTYWIPFEEGAMEIGQPFGRTAAVHVAGDAWFFTDGAAFSAVKNSPRTARLVLSIRSPRQHRRRSLTMI